MSIERSRWVVHKFGGTSVANADRYKKVAEIVHAEPGTNKAIVVSAMSGVTDALIGLVDMAKRRDPNGASALSALTKRHLDTIEALLPAPEAAALSAAIESDAKDISDVLRAIWLGRSCSEQTLELVAGYGELWSAQILAAHLRARGEPTAWLDARAALIVRPAEIGPIVDWEASRALMGEWLQSRAREASRLVITGYIASTPDGAPTTLKRNGSDFSASIFGALLETSAIVIWTDVDGVLSADPRRVPEAVVLDEMSYDEAMELAYFGAKVLHPRTMTPAVEHGIPIWIRNTFNASHPGTKIHSPPPRPESALATDAAHAVKGFSTIDRIALVNVEGTGMVGVPGIAQRLFGALREVGVSVVLISQASSEHSICFAVPDAQADLAKATVTKAFKEELEAGMVQRVEVVPGCSILAAVGDAMAFSPGVAAKFFGALAGAGVNVRAIAQGSSERNISAVIDGKDSTRGLRAAHAGFYLSDQTLSVGVIGPGLVGGTLLAQLAAQAPVLRSQFKIDLRLRGLASSKKMLLDDAGLDLGSCRERLQKDGTAPDYARFADHLQPDHLPHALIIDCTSSEEIAARYGDWLERGIHVITPNKKAGSGPLESYRRLRRLSRERATHYFYEATVGAGLPVISTLRDLIQTGDKVQRIEGVLSGTLSFVFNTFDGVRPFSEIVREAKRLGYTEPDPRDDLSGLDVARKLIILAREIGLDLELGDIRVQNLTPEELRTASAEEFLDRLPAFDPVMSRLHAEARANGEVLRYVGVVDASGSAAVELRRYSSSHAFARISRSDNILSFKTARYFEQPLVVQGPGAGPEVTAGGVFADLLRLAAHLGAPS